MGFFFPLQHTNTRLKSYGRAKLANILHAQQLAERCRLAKDDSLISASCHPGVYRWCMFFFCVRLGVNMCSRSFRCCCYQHLVEFTRALSNPLRFSWPPCHALKSACRETVGWVGARSKLGCFKWRLRRLCSSGWCRRVPCLVAARAR